MPISFDDLTPGGIGAPSAPSTPSAATPDNMFSDLGPPKESSGIIRRGIGDPLIGLARGAAVGIPETAVGLLDIPTMGYAGKAVEAVGKGLGIGGFKEGREYFNKMLTPETQEAQRKVSEAEGFVDTVKTAVQNPSSIIQVVAESIPAMLTGTRLVSAGQKALGYGIKETGALAGKELLAAEASNKAKQIVTGALGEAAVTAGQNIESVRQETEDKLLTPMQVGINVASAAVTGIIGTLGGKLANRLGVEDINTLMAGGFGGANKKNLIKGVLYGAFQEGALEELPQSMQEQIAQNISLGKPIDDQIFEQGAIGLLAGMVQATGAQAAGGLMQQLRARDVNQQNIDQQLSEMPPEVQEAVGGLDGNVTANQLNVERQVATEVEKANAAIDQAEQTVTTVTPPTEAAPAVIPEAIRAEVAAMSDRNLAITAEKDREPIVRQAAAEEIQRRASAPAAAPVAEAPVIEKPAAAPSDIIMKTLEGKTQTQLDTLANEQPDTPIGIAARALWNKNATNAERILKEKEQAAAPAAAEKIDYEAQAAAKGISLDNFKKVQNIGELNKWAKEGVEGAQIELARRAQEGLIQPKEITWNIPEAAAPTQPAAGEPTAQGTKVPKAAPFAREVKVKDEVPTRIAKIVDYHKNVLNQGKSAEDKLKTGKAIGMQMAAVQRKIEGKPTKTETAKAQKYLESMYNGRPVTVDGQPAVATGKTSYGKHQVRMPDGTEQFLPLSKIAAEKVTKDDVRNYLKTEGLKELEQAERIIAPAAKEGEVKHGTAKEPGRPAAGPEGGAAERNRNVSEVQEKHQREVVSARQGILAPNGGPPGLQEEVRKGEDRGIVLYPEGYASKEYQDVLAVAQKYDLDVIPVQDTSGMTNAFIKGNSVFLNMTPGDISFMEAVLHEISHHLGNAETQAKVDTESNAFIKYRQKLIAFFEAELTKEFVLEEYAADLESGTKSRYGINLADGLKPGTTVASLSESGGKTKASGDISYSIARDKGARILEEGAPKKFKKIVQIANFLSRRVPIDYKTATTAEAREVERKLADFLKVSMEKLPKAKGWYKKDFAKTMKILEALDPSIKKPENNFRMRLAIAIASNGNDSIKTIEVAWSAYRNWIDNGSFLPTAKSKNTVAINDHSDTINELRSHFKNDLEMEKWLMGYDTSRNIEAEVGYLIDLSAGEKKDTEIPRASAVIGPKLGAFFNNLSGNFDPVTMDRWFMRTIGRIMGNIVKTTDIDKNRERLRDAVTDDVIAAVWGNELGIVRASELTEDDLDSLALSINRGKWEVLKGKYDEARNAGNRLAESLNGQLKDSPSSGGEREWIRERMEKVRKNYPQFDLSDIQAAIWIGEKELYHELGGQREEADYYSDGAEALVRKTGKSDVLRRIAGRTGQIRPEAAGGKEQPALFSIREPSKEQRLKSGLSYQVMDMIRANPDGFTIDITTGGMVEKGYAVAPTKRTETPLDELTDENVDAFLLRNQDLFEADDRAFFGGWLDQDEKSENFGKYVLDVSYVVDSYEDAVYIAEIGAQDGIYHIEAGRYIPTRDGLKDLKTRGLFKAGKRAELRGIQEGMHRIIESRRPDQTKIDYSVRGTARSARTEGQLANRGRAGEVQGQIYIESGVHWSDERRTTLDSKFYGTGLADATSRRLPSDPKSPLRHRIHFYYNPGTGMPPPEVGVGPYMHDVDLSKYKIFDLSSGAIKISQVEGEDWRNTLEKAILKAGFDGFANPDYGVAVLLGKRKVDVQPADVKYSVREADARYLELAKDPEKNKAELQKMVDEAAKAAGYNVGPVYHGTTGTHTVFDLTKRGSVTMDADSELAFFFSDNKQSADSYAGAAVFELDYEGGEKRVIDAYLSIKNPHIKDFKGGEYDEEKYTDSLIYAAEHEYDGVIFKNVYDGVLRGKREMDTVYAVFNPTQIKSADPVTRDAKGNIIPLSERFNPEQADIRYSVRQTNTPEFKKWFGNSKVVDENGDPLVVYHGTPANFNEFYTWSHFGTAEQANYRVMRAGLDPGINIIPVYLSIKNPLRLTDIGFWDSAGEVMSALEEEAQFSVKTLRQEVDSIIEGYEGEFDPKIEAQALDHIGEWLKKHHGYDGIVYRNGEEGKGDSYIPFSSTQIKSAIGNVGTFDNTNPDIRFSIKEAAMALPEQIHSLISAGLSGFAEHPENLPKAEVAKVVDELKTHKDFSKLEYALSVPARMAQKHPQTWGKLYRIFAVDREETRDELRQEFQKKAEPFLMYDRHLHDKKVTKAEIAASMGRIERAVITGDAIAAEFTDEQLTEGINDKYGKELKLNKDEIAAYRAVRDTLRYIRTVLVNHLANQTLRGYRRNKWFRILEAAMKGDALNVETLQTLLDKKGMKQAALDRAKKLQPNITKIFERIEAGVDKIPPQELAKAGKAYEKIANSLQAELTELQGYVSELTGENDKAKLTEMTREIFSAYMQTRPQMKVIRALRNEVGALDGYFPRFRESGEKKFRVYEQELDENGNIVIDEKTGKEARREVFMKMFSNARQGNEVIKEAMQKLKIKQSDLTPDGKFPSKYFVEISRQTASPESAYQGVNDINLQRLFDDAMRAAQEKGVHGLETTYTDANGREVDVFEQIRQAGLQSLTNHLKARGAMQRSIKRSEDLIEGYQETDLQRVLLDYITSMSGLMTKQVAASEAMELMSTIKDPFLFSSMARYNREMLRNNSLADRISGYTRAAAFTYFLGGLLKSAVVNMTQNPIVGFAELAKFMRDNHLGGAGKSDLVYMKAMKDVLAGNLTEDEKAFIDKMVNRGIAANQFIQSVFDNVMNKGLRRHIAVMNFLAKPFSMSEVFNRKSAAIAMYRTAYSMRLAEAKAKGLTGEAAAAEAERMTFDDARDFVTNVHYAYGKTNRPLPIMTGDALGAAAASLYTFKGFSHNFLARQAELLSKGDFKTLGHTLAYLVLFGGLSAFPFLRDLFDWWEKEYGYNPMSQVRASLRGIGGQTLEKFGVSGLPSVLGANFSGSLATGLPWPIGASSPEDSIFGVWAGVATKVGRGAKAFAHGDLNRGITEIAPEFLRAPRVALRESEIGKQLLGTPGYATNVRGHAILGEDGKPISMSSWEAALKAMGFNPTDYARAKEKTQNIVRQTAWVNDLKKNVAERYRAARLNNDKDATKDMMNNVREVNAKIRSRNLQRLVTPLKVSNVIKSAKPKIGVRQRREMLYKREEL